MPMVRATGGESTAATDARTKRERRARPMRAGPSPRCGLRRPSGAVDGADAGPVGAGHRQVARRAVALRVVHDRRRVVRRQRTPVVVLEAGADLGAGVLVA